MKKSRKPELSFILFIPLIIILTLIIILLVILIKRKRNAAIANENLQNIPQWQRNILNRANNNANNANNNDNVNNNANPIENLRGEARLRHAQEIRQRALARAALARGEAVDNMADVRNENGEVVEEEAENVNEEIHVKKIGKKKAEHLRRKEQRQQYIQWVEAQRQHKKERERLKEEDAKKRKAKELKRIEKEEEKMMKIKEQMRKKEELLKKELEKQRQEDEARHERMISQTSEIISYLESNSPVSIEAVASHFDLRVQETRAYIEELINNNNIIGTFDIQGRFISITETQLLKLRKIIEGAEYQGQINTETFIDLCQKVLLQHSTNEDILLDDKIKNNTNIKLTDQTVVQRKQWKGKDSLE